MTLPPIETYFPFQLANLFWSFVRTSSQDECLRGLTLIGIPRKEKGKWLIAREKKSDAAFRKSCSTLNPKTLFLWKLTTNPDTKSKPYNTSLIDHKFSHEASPTINVLYVYCSKSNSKFSANLQGYKQKRERAILANPIKSSTAKMKRKRDRGPLWRSPLFDLFLN